MLRAMSLSDADAVAALVREAFAAQAVVTDPLPSALRVTAADVEAHLRRGGGGAVACVDDGLAGSVLWEEQDGGLYVSRVAVAPAWRRRGVARALVAAAEAATRAMQLPRVHLATRLVLADNRRLFAACGFVETERTAHPGYTEPTSVAMEKILTSPARAGEVDGA
jgi:N-acetylglutamate synthase-like GNAT family acetyltransferase